MTEQRNDAVREALTEAYDYIRAGSPPERWAVMVMRLSKALSPSPASSPVGEGLISELTDALEDAKNNGFGEEFFRRAVNDLLARARAYPSVTERRSVGRLSKAVVSLVIAAREAWEVDCVSGDDLDKALEPFAALVPYENEPDREALSPLSGEPEAYYADDEPLSAEDQARIDAAWEKHKAADPVCRIPPEGWSCSRAAGHEGPCAASPLGEPASVAVEADNCDKCDDSGYIRENGRQEFCDCICGHDAMDQAEGVGLHALSKPTPVEAGLREDNRKMRQALDLISTWSPNTGGRLFPVATAQAAIAALSENPPSQE